MKIGYRPVATSRTSVKPAICMDVSLHRSRVISDRLLTEALTGSDLPNFLQGDESDAMRRAAEYDWTQPFGYADQGRGAPQ